MLFYTTKTYFAKNLTSVSQFTVFCIPQIMINLTYMSQHLMYLLIYLTYIYMPVPLNIPNIYMPLTYRLVCMAARLFTQTSLSVCLSGQGLIPLSLFNQLANDNHTGLYTSIVKSLLSNNGQK